MVRVFLSLAALAVLSLATSCVGPPRAPVAPPPPVRVVTPPPPAAPAVLPTDWRDWPQTPGDWDYRRYDGRSSATFGSGDQGRLVLWCAAPGTIRLMVPGAVPGPATVRTSSMTRTLALGAVGTSRQGIGAVLGASDPLLDAIGFSRGRFVVEQAGAPPLVLPAWAEVERVVEDCRG